jgi:hypothetical protein
VTALLKSPGLRLGLLYDAPPGLPMVVSSSSLQAISAGNLEYRIPWQTFG